jgi:hypothetical protein
MVFSRSVGQVVLARAMWTARRRSRASRLSGVARRVDVLLYPYSRTDLANQLADEAVDRDKIGKTCSRTQGCLSADFFGLDLLTHEAAHSEQWTHYTDVADFGIAYGNSVTFSAAACGSYGSCNKFEIGANPFKGGYWERPHVDPDSGLFVFPSGLTQAQHDVYCNYLGLTCKYLGG